MILATVEHGWEGLYVLMAVVMIGGAAVLLGTAFFGVCVTVARNTRDLWYKLRRGTDQR